MAHHRKLVSETHREREERLDALGAIELAPPAQQLVWNLADELARIDAAAAVLARGRVAIAEYPIVAVLRGRTVEQAREETRERYRAAMRLAGEAGRLAA